MRKRFQNITVLFKDKRVKRPLNILIFLFAFSLLSPLLTNNKPLVCSIDNTTYFPAFNDIINTSPVYVFNGKRVTNSTDWNSINFDWKVFPPFKNSFNYKDKSNNDYATPFSTQLDKSGSALSIRTRHLLGTDKLGRDTFATLFSGIKYSIFIGFISIFISSIIGVFLGGISGYYDKPINIGYGLITTIFISLFFIWFYGWYVRSYALSHAFSSGVIWFIFSILLSLIISVGIGFGFYKLGSWIDKKLPNRGTLISLDSLFTGFTIVFSAIPRLLILIAVGAIVQEKSTLLLIVVLGLTSWVGIARITRAEILKIKNEKYIEAATTLGLNPFQIITKHILPNAFPVILTTIIYGIGGVILIESSLSFLNIGVPNGTPTLGGLLKLGREHIEAWWLIIPPGIVLAYLLYLLNKIATGISKHRATD